jgi:RNA polymerase sigma-70 factor (ECF subfamily)
VNTQSSVADDFSVLLHRARSGDPEALNAIFVTCRQYMLLIANQDAPTELQAKQAPSDLVQTALTRAAENFDQFQGGTEEALFGWMRAILKNELHQVARSFGRTKKRDLSREEPVQHLQKAEGNWRRMPLADPQITPATEAQLREESKLLRDAILALPADYREVIVLRNWERLSFAETGTRMGRSENAVKKLWGRALAELGRALRHVEQTRSHLTG